MCAYLVPPLLLQSLSQLLGILGPDYTILNPLHEIITDTIRCGFVVIPHMDVFRLDHLSDAVICGGGVPSCPSLFVSIVSAMYEGDTYITRIGDQPRIIDVFLDK